MVLEAVAGGVVAALTGGITGALLLGKAIGATWGDSAEGEIVMGLACGVSGIAAGLIGGVAGVLLAYRSDAGARRRFWFALLASFFGLLLVVPRWMIAADRLVPNVPQRYVYFQASVLPLVCGAAGQLLGLLNDDQATRGQPAHKRRRLVSICLLLALLATATLPFLVCRTR
jgi:hypothetical protein